MSLASPLNRHWRLDPEVDFLNHGSFGATPEPVLERQRELQEELERQPVAFLARTLPDRIDAVRNALAPFLGADPEGLVLVPNATAAVNAVVRSLRFSPGDELLTTDHAYNACANVLDWVARRSGAKVVRARIPFPVAGPGEVEEAVLSAATSRTRLALLDHVTSPTGLVLPLAQLVAELEDRSVPVLVDGAHAPGMLDLDVEAVGASWYTGNFHKWVCAPKGAAFLWVREDHREETAPTSVSHGWNVRRPGRSLLHDLFDWTGTADPTSLLAVPEAIRFVGSLAPGGWPEVRRRNRELALAGRRDVAEALEIPLPCPDPMVGSLAALPLPDAPLEAVPRGALYVTPLQERLLERFAIEVPVIPWPAHPHRLLRISAHLYNAPAQYRKLGRTVKSCLEEESRGQ